MKEKKLKFAKTGHTALAESPKTPEKAPFQEQRFNGAS